MSLSNLSNSVQEIGIKFSRRPDLDFSTRLHIATTALSAMNNHYWGTISNMAEKYTISRTFIYMLAATLIKNDSLLFGTTVQQTKSKTLAYKYLLSLRLEGGSSVGAISTMMKRFGIGPNSTGTISELLSYFGSLLPNTLSSTKANNEAQMVVFLSDEIFSQNIPILITVDADSSAILRIELANSRKADDWKNHWKCLEENNIFASYLVCDEGVGLCSAHQGNLSDSDIVRQSDTYHAIAHTLGSWIKRLEGAAYIAIEKEDTNYKKLDSAKSENTINKRVTQYENSQVEAETAILLYDDFQFLYSCLLEQLRIFDSNGTLLNGKDAKENIKIGLELIETLKINKLTKSVNKIRRTLPNLFHYFDVAQKIMAKLNQLEIDKDVLRALCLAWQWNKGKIKAKNTDRRKQCSQNEKDWLELVSDFLQEEYQKIKEQVYGELDKIVQSSALVECINSIIRPYLNNSKNNITQETLNLIMFYHNHRFYKDGKRKGKTPMEILSKTKQDKDWIELLFEVVAQKDPTFSSFSQ